MQEHNAVPSWPGQKPVRQLDLECSALVHQASCCSFLLLSKTVICVYFYIAFNLTEICDPGYFCPAGSVRPIPCPWGTYQPKAGQSSARACIQCPDFDKLNNSISFNTIKPAANITDCPSVEQGTKNL